jgi:hypothetical protein
VQCSGGGPRWQKRQAAWLQHRLQLRNGVAGWSLDAGLKNELKGVGPSHCSGRSSLDDC